MGIASSFEPERLLVALLYTEGRDFAPLAAALEARLGPPDFIGPELRFEWTDYYEAEMGGRLRRGFYSYPRLVDPPLLAELKLWTNELEKRFSADGRRLYNIDPGLLSLGRFCLATTKDRSHRIPLGKGIFAELTLLFERGEWRPLPWTYADWRSAEYRAVLDELRRRYRLERRA